MFNSQATEETFGNLFHIKYHITLETEFPTRNEIESMTDSSKNTTVSIEIFNKIITLKNPLFKNYSDIAVVQHPQRTWSNMLEALLIQNSSRRQRIFVLLSG